MAIRTDPTQLGTTRSRVVKIVRKIFDQLEKGIGALVEDEDVFGLDFHAVTFNTRWEFEIDTKKIELFREWLQEQVDASNILSTSKEPWFEPFLESAYRQAINRTYRDVRKEDTQGRIRGTLLTKDEFLSKAFSSKISTERLQMIFTRSFEKLRAMTEEMASNLTVLLAGGFAHGIGARALATELKKSVGISKQRALTIARTELTYAYAEGQLDAFQELGVNEIGVMSEWLTAGDNRVCKQCSALEGSVYTPDEARGLIPRHPNCRCAWIPSVASGKEQAKAIKRTQSQLKKSVKEEKPKSTDSQKASKWKGADAIGKPSQLATQFNPKKESPYLRDHTPSSVVRWMTKEGYSKSEITKALQDNNVPISPAEVQESMNTSRKGRPTNFSPYDQDFFRSLFR